MAFEKYIISRRRVPFIYISESGRQARFNLAAMQQCFNGMRYLDWYYDKDTNRLAVQPVEVKSTGSTCLNHKRGTTYSRSVLHYFGITHEVGRTYVLTNEDGLLVIDLNNPKPMQARRQKKVLR